MRGDRTTTSSIAGELITERLEFDGGRQVTVYIPPVAAEAIVFAGDGHLVSEWSRSLETADTPSTMIVGVHRLSDETLRLDEYSPGFEPERVRLRLGPERGDPRSVPTPRARTIGPRSRAAL
jgi:hypothetical protein